MKPLTLVLLLSIALVLTAGATIVLFSNSQIITVKTYTMMGKVGNTSGLGFNGTLIFFGEVKPGGTSWREMMMRNNESFPVRVVMQSEGDIAPLVRPEAPEVILSPLGERVIKLYFKPPEGTPLRNYIGTLRVVVRRA